ncbi:hypothetical protein E4U51_000279 [Claviceps purpurea]|nr:hypothetical protein E4U51_000279 [Claviceps purpurea]
MATPETSAFGGTNFKPTGLAANKKLKPYGINQDADNLAYDPKARETRSQPEVFEGFKAQASGQTAAPTLF